MADPNDLFALADEWLTVCAGALDSLTTLVSPALEGAPDRRFVSGGVPVWDCCDQLAVHVHTINEMDTGPGGLETGKRTKAGWKNQVGLTATITRCVPTGELSVGGNYIPPTTGALTDAAKQILADGWALWNHLHNKQAAGQLLTLCANVVFQGVVPVIPSGGCAGWTARAVATLDGYNETFGT